MNEQEKSLALAELMGWECTNGNWYDDKGSFIGYATLFNPYHNYRWESLAQFAAIMLKYPEVMTRIAEINFFDCAFPTIFRIEPTQANILDEILRMEGKL